MFELPLQKYTNAVAISNDCTKTSTIDYTYNQEQKLIEEKETVTFSNDNKTFISYKKYTYYLYGNIINKREFNYTLKSDNYLEEILFTNTATNEGMNETNNSEASNEINRNYIDYNYVCDGDKLISIDDVLQITYDNQGRPTTYNGMNLSWDFRNLVSIGNNTFTYDGLGRRISKNNINFTYDSDNRLIKQSNGLEFFYDDETGLFWCNSRYYNPEWGALDFTRLN